MISPRPSLTTTSSEGNSSEDEDPEASGVPAPAQPRTSQPQTNVVVGSIAVHPKSKMPGVLNGTVNNTTFNVLLNPVNLKDDFEPADINHLVTDAVKIKSKTFESFYPSDANSSSNKLTGTKEDVEGFSRRWCYLISALMTLSIITLIGTAVLSLTSWRTSQGSAPTLPPITSTQVILDGLSAEERHFAGIPNGPRIVTRPMWKAVLPEKLLDKNILPATMVVVCHTATSNCSSQTECSSKMRAMQGYQKKERGYADLGYNFLIGGDGSVYWSRGFTNVGEHTQGYNYGSIAVAFIGNYVKMLPNESQIEAFNQLIELGVKEGKISRDYTLVAQCQLKATLAPGLALAENMRTWPHFNSSLPIGCE